MPATAAISAFGTLLKKGDGATPENFTGVAEVLDINGLDLSLATEDATSQNSPGGWEEHIATVLSMGELTCTIQYVPTAATHNATTGLVADLANKTRRNWQLVFPNVGATTWSFAAFVAGFAPRAPVKGKLTAELRLRPTGQPTLA